MIRINLLQEKKAKRAVPGEQTVAIGFGIVILAGVLVFFFVHQPMGEKVDEAAAANQRLKKAIAQLQEETKDFDVIRQQAEAVRAQQAAIERLNGARATPAWLLAELSNILTKDHKPTMTAEMRERVKQDLNRRWSDTWDPKRVWIRSFEETEGNFTLIGGAQADEDVTQLVLRLQASVFFDDVVPEGLEGASDRASGVNYYTFTIKGKVRY